MSKRDIFERNIKQLTRARSIARAVEGWEIAHDISLTKGSSGATCRLCGTRFFKGALVRRPASGTRKAVTITVGGTCLGTILRGSFADRATLVVRKKEVVSRLRQMYGALFGDPGNWIKWILENAPARLAHLAAQLHHLQMVRTDRELNRLIAFHDASCRYPTAALLPVLDPTLGASRIPNSLTINEARAILKGLTPVQFGKMLLRRSNEFREREIAALGEDFAWRSAWQRLNDLEQRAVAAIAKLSNDLDALDSARIAKLIGKLAPVPKTHVVPFFVWVGKRGLAVVEELGETEDAATAWIWREDKYPVIDLSSCKSASPISEDAAVELEAMAFWEQPPWYRGRLAVPITPAGAKSASPQTNTGAHLDEQLRQIPCIRDMLTIAAFEGQRALPDQFRWLRSRVRELGYEWDDVVWCAERYSTDPDCHDKIKGIMARLSK